MINILIMLILYNYSIIIMTKIIIFDNIVHVGLTEFSRSIQSKFTFSCTMFRNVFISQ